MRQDRGLDEGPENSRQETASHPKLAAGLLMAGVVLFLIVISLAPLL